LTDFAWRRSGVARLIVRQGGLVALAGIAVGLATALAGSRVIESLLRAHRRPACHAQITMHCFPRHSL
jgi:hypothetical protein